MGEENLEQMAKAAKPEVTSIPSRYQVPQGDYRTPYQYNKDIEEAEQRGGENGGQQWGDDWLSNFLREIIT